MGFKETLIFGPSTLKAQNFKVFDGTFNEAYSIVPLSSTKQCLRWTFA